MAGLGHGREGAGGHEVVNTPDAVSIATVKPSGHPCRAMHHLLAILYPRYSR